MDEHQIDDVSSVFDDDIDDEQHHHNDTVNDDDEDDDGDNIIVSDQDDEDDEEQLNVLDLEKELKSTNTYWRSPLKGLRLPDMESDLVSEDSCSM